MDIGGHTGKQEDTLWYSLIHMGLFTKQYNEETPQRRPMLRYYILHCTFPCTVHAQKRVSMNLGNPDVTEKSLDKHMAELLNHGFGIMAICISV